MLLLFQSKIRSETTADSQRGLLSDSLPSRLPLGSRVMIREPIRATPVPALSPNDLPVSTNPPTRTLGTKRSEEKPALKPERSKSKEVSKWLSGTD